MVTRQKNTPNFQESAEKSSSSTNTPALQLHLPWPPTANTYWRYDRGRTHISTPGRNYRKKVMLACDDFRGFGDSAVVVDILLSPPDRRRRDIDNIQKPLLDALQHIGVYDDDKQVDDLRTRRNRDENGNLIIIPNGLVTVLIVKKLF